MAARLLSGTETSKQIQAELLPQIEELKRAGVIPCLAAVLVGDNPASQIYVRNKMRACEKLGLRSEHITPPTSSTTAELVGLVQELNRRDDVDGILVQLPLPSQVDTQQVLLAVDPAKDVDGFHPMNVGALVRDRKSTRLNSVTDVSRMPSSA